MTDALHPGRGIGLVAPRAGAVPRARAKPEPRRPVHLAVAIGFSAGAYAVALAGVTGLQSASDRALVAKHDPTSETLDLMQEGHDRLDTRLTAAGAAYDQAAAAYDEMTGRLGALEGRLGALAGEVATVQGSAAWTPPVWHAPSVGSRSARSSGGTTHATTCASGKTCP